MGYPKLNQTWTETYKYSDVAGILNSENPKSE